MSYRYMRILVFFDLPTETSEERADYRAFRKFLIKSGFIMMQESVYSKIVLNNTVGDAVRENIRKHKVKKGLVQVLSITEKQYEKIELLVGEDKQPVVNNDKRLVVL